MTKQAKEVQVEENVWVTLKNLQRYKTQSDAQLSEKIIELEGKIANVDAKFITATKEQIEELF